MEEAKIYFLLFKVVPQQEFFLKSRRTWSWETKRANQLSVLTETCLDLHPRCL